jgi:hypothetical protein
MSTEGTLISDEMQAIVGTPLNPTTSFPIAASDIRKWAMAVYYPAPPPRLFWDEEYAAGTHFGGIVAPEEFNPFAWMARSSSSASGGALLEAAAGVAPPEIRATLVGSVEVEYSGVRMRPGDVIHSTDMIEGYREREGRMGLQLYTTWAVNWVNEDDEHVKTHRTVFVRYR